MSYYVYIPIGSADHLLVLAMDPDSGQLEQKHQVPLGKSGHAACADPQNKTLYVGLRDGEEYALAGYAIDQQTGGLTPLGEVAVEGMHARVHWNSLVLRTLFRSSIPFRVPKYCAPPNRVCTSAFVVGFWHLNGNIHRAARGSQGL